MQTDVQPVVLKQLKYINCQCVKLPDQTSVMVNQLNCVQQLPLHTYGAQEQPHNVLLYQQAELIQ